MTDLAAGALGEIWWCGKCGAGPYRMGAFNGFPIIPIPCPNCHHDLSAYAVRHKASDFTAPHPDPKWEEGRIMKRPKPTKPSFVRKDDNMLDRVMTFDVESIDIDEMVELLTFGSNCVSTYEANDLEVPARLSENLALLRTEIGRRATDNREKALREIDREIEGMKTKEERKGDLLAQRERLLTKLGKK